MTTANQAETRQCVQWLVFFDRNGCIHMMGARDKTSDGAIAYVRQRYPDATNFRIFERGD
jgi:hypothetical protein